jgi:hypothetical protein
MSSTADTCSFVADQSDWQEWGGFAEDWPKILNKLNIGRDVWECPFESLERITARSTGPHCSRGVARRAAEALRSGLRW